jgi:hypothetical protein
MAADPDPSSLQAALATVGDSDVAHGLTDTLRTGRAAAPEDATPHRAKMSDVLMLLMFDGARERTAGQYRDLLEDTGWQLEQVVPSPGPMSVIEASRSATR